MGGGLGGEILLVGAISHPALPCFPLQITRVQPQAQMGRVQPRGLLDRNSGGLFGAIRRVLSGDNNQYVCGHQ